jgi:hypothetical protein
MPTRLTIILSVWAFVIGYIIGSIEMTTEQKISEAYIKAVADDKYVCNEHSFTAGYMAGMAEAFESAAKLCDEKADSLNACYMGENASGAWKCAAAIREMAKESGK